MRNFRDLICDLWICETTRLVLGGSICSCLENYSWVIRFLPIFVAEAFIKLWGNWAKYFTLFVEHDLQFRRQFKSSESH